MNGPVIFFLAASKWKGVNLLSIPKLISRKILWRPRVTIPPNIFVEE